MPALPPDRPGCPKSPGARRPLPDAAAIRLFLVPDPAPPYDDDVCGAEPGRGGLPAGTPGGRAGEPGNAGESGHGEPADHGVARGVPRNPAAVPGGPPGWENRFAQVLAETLAGARPPRQMAPWTTKEALQRIQRLGPQLASAQRPTVRRVLTSAPAVDVMELAVVVGFGPRVKALAVRLERAGAGPRPGPGQGVRTGARWVCTAVEAA